MASAQSRALGPGQGRALWSGQGSALEPTTMVWTESLCSTELGYICKSEEIQEMCPQYYRGTVSQTVTGKQCQRWDTNTPHMIPSEYMYDINGVGPHDYCRNPTGDLNGPFVTLLIQTLYGSTVMFAAIR
ncbi:hepatocyte growth factor-like protein [Amphiura filiformis]|uniref:hepatocyte growth factor-like protein n=1 Tax=Amphiura filiformis TaxID=82378 RepID=UPI003B2159FB